jgi:YkoY family integral membrane protein
MFEASDILTILLLVLLEGLLSADNAMVLAVLVLGLPKAQQRQALRYGILGAFAFRAIATLLATILIKLAWVKLIGAGYLLYLVYHHFGRGVGAEDRRGPPKAQAWLGMTAFWATVVKVELTDIVFAIDSILVAVAMSQNLWVILTGGLLGIVMMRLVIGQLLALVERYPPLVDGAFIIIGWVGSKLHRVPPRRGLRRVRNPEMAVTRPDRGDLRGGSVLRSPAREAEPHSGGR